MAAMAATDEDASAGLSECWEVQGRHEGSYTGGKIVFAEARQQLLSLCSETVHVADALTGASLQRISHEGDGILTFAVDPSGKSICTSHRSGLLRHFLLGPPSSLVRSWRAHEKPVADLDFDASGGLIASGSTDSTVKVCDVGGYFVTHNFTGHTGIVKIVRFHPKKLQLVSASGEEARLWDLKMSTCLAVMKDHLSAISSLCFAREKGSSYQLVTGGRDQVVNVWRIEAPGCPRIKQIVVFEAVDGLTAVPTAGLVGKPTDGAFGQWLGKKELPPYVIFTVGEKGLLQAFSPVDGKLIDKKESPHALKGALHQVHCLDSTTGRRIMTVGEDYNLVMWAVPELTVEGYIMGYNEEITHVQFIPSVQPAARSVEDGKEEANGAAVKAPVIATPTRFVCLANDEFPRLVTCEGFGATLLRGHTDNVISCDVSVDGRWIATGSKDQSIIVWSATSCRMACKVAGHAGAVSALSFPRRRPRKPAAAETLPLHLVSASEDKTMKVWELPSPAKLEEAAAGDSTQLSVGKATVTVVAHAKEVNDVVVAPNNKLIASSGADKLVRIWKFPEANLAGECKGHRKPVWCVAFSPMDQVIASASSDQTVRLWNLKDFTAIKSFQGHSSAVLRVCFLSSGMQLMTSSLDGMLKLWNIRTADCAATFEEHTARVWCIDTVGDRMVSGGSDSKLCIWRDVTSERSKETRDAHAEEVMKDSRIGVLVHEGKVEEAMTLALDLNRPAQMRQILTDFAVDAIGKGGLKMDGGDSDKLPDLNLRRWVLSLSSARLERLVELIERWNSNRRMASLAQMLMSLVLMAVPSSTLASIEGMNATCSTLLSYSTRHKARVEALLQKTFLFDFVLQSSSQGLSIQDGLPNGAGDAGSALRQTMDVLLGGDDEEDDAVVGLADSDSSDGEAGGEGGEAPEAADTEAAQAAAGEEPSSAAQRKGVGVRKRARAAGAGVADADAGTKKSRKRACSR